MQFYRPAGNGGKSELLAEETGGVQIDFPPRDGRKLVLHGEQRQARARFQFELDYTARGRD